MESSYGRAISIVGGGAGCDDGSFGKEQKILDTKLDPTLKALKELDADGMLECWILLDHADQGIAQDYVAYRARHRDLLHAYVAKYDVHPY